MIQSTIAKLQGKDSWPIACATVTGRECVYDGEHDGPPTAEVTFYYHDRTNELQSGSLKTDSMTSLYNLGKGDTFDVRYNPKKPSQYYSDENQSIFDDVRLGFWLCFALAALVIAGLIAFKF